MLTKEIALQPFALLSDRIVTPEGLVHGAVWVAQDGTIADVTPVTALPRDLKRVDVSGAVVLPGIVDSHVHVNEPGRTDWEGFETATQAAAAGGITTIVDMPLNCDPVTTSAAALRTKLKAIKGKLTVDCGFYGGLIPSNRSELEPLAKAGVLGFKAFMADSGIAEFPQVTPKDLMQSMPVIAGLGLPLLAHAELEGVVAPAQFAPEDYRSYLASRPKSWENAAIRILITEAMRTNCRVHVVHLSSAEALPVIATARSGGVPITVETCPHYLSFCAEEIASGDTRFKCAPPIRERDNREALWAGLKAQGLDAIVSDHSPCTPQLKNLEHGHFASAWGGISGLQFSLSVVWTEAQQRGLDIVQLSALFSGGPARLVGLSHRKGQIAKGKDADLVVFAPDAEWTLDEGTIRHRHKLTPYSGRRLKGQVMTTFLRGQKVYEHGTVTTEPRGEFLLRNS